MAYEELAETIICGGITREELLKTARFKPGLGLKDLKEIMAKDYHPPFTTEAMIAQAENRLKSVLEIIV